MAGLRRPKDVPGGGLPEAPATWLSRLAITIVLLTPSLAFIFCALRFYIRIRMKKVGVDDWLIGAAMVLSIAQAVGGYIFVKASYSGHHMWEVPDYDMDISRIWGFVNTFTYRPILTLVRVSVLVFLLKICGVKTWARIFIWCQIVVNLITFPMILLTYSLICRPWESNWAPKALAQHCDKQAPFSIFTAALTMLLDVLVLSVPFCIFTNLRIALRLKIAIISMFLLGLVVTAIGGCRLWILYVRLYGPKWGDPYFNIGYTTQPLESNLAIMTACLPALWPLARQWFPCIFQRLGISDGYQGQIQYIETRETGDKTQTKGSLAKIKGLFGSNRSNKSSGSRQYTQRAAGLGFARHTIGGTTIVDTDRMRRDDVGVLTEIRVKSYSSSYFDYDEPTYNDIIRTTNYYVPRDMGDRSPITPPRQSHQRPF